MKPGVSKRSVRIRFSVQASCSVVVIRKTQKEYDQKELVITRAQLLLFLLIAFYQRILVWRRNIANHFNFYLRIVTDPRGAERYISAKAFITRKNNCAFFAEHLLKVLIYPTS